MQLFVKTIIELKMIKYFLYIIIKIYNNNNQKKEVIIFRNK